MTSLPPILSDLTHISSRHIFGIGTMDPLSIASGIAGLITLSTPVLAAGYNYVRIVTDAPEDLRSLVRETGSLNALLSELMAHSLVEEIDHQAKIEISTQQQTLQECEDIVHGIESLVRACKDGHDSQTKHAVNTVFWPLRQKEITRLRNRLMRLFTILSASISIENSMVLQNLKHEQRRGSFIMRGLEKNSRDLQEQKMLDWLSPLDSTAKHLSTSQLRHPDTYK
ncbi:hypothetical protein HYALB_00011344 [Hymenoscyphus albidus]|uniref:Azaphilone pigments biosynthesis cluster protein L N-terminal domain-containing protein n=1 Tax=Hymenoscyphus albidus TaxID=595503 RepID=A0A9N9M0F7_9HELO|nr:hypothetical protein HYALB_00011344 [Hymenoscyphus albidus]